LKVINTGTDGGKNISGEQWLPVKTAHDRWHWRLRVQRLLASSAFAFDLIFLVNAIK